MIWYHLPNQIMNSKSAISNFYRKIKSLYKPKIQEGVMQRRVFLLGMLVLLVMANLAFSQNTGKIDGRVTDRITGDPLPGVNVIIQETQMGAASDAEGYFYIINITPGEYTLTARMMGYKNMTIEKVRVIVGQTSKANFRMEETVLDMEEVVVTAERPLVDKDVTSKVSTYSFDEIKNMPAEDMTKVLALNSNITILTNTPYAKRGYNTRDVADIRMRGGRNNELGLYIDGMKVGNPLFGGFGTRVNNNAINQMTVSAGGFSPEYGNSLSGVINLSTRQGGNRISGQLEYGTTVPFGIEALATDEGIQRKRQDVTFSLNGPVPFFKKLKFFVSGNLNTQAADVFKADDIIWDEHNFYIDADGNRVDLPTTAEIMQDLAYDGYLDVISSSEARLTQTSHPVGGRIRWVHPFDSFKGWKGFGWRNTADWLGNLTYRFTPNIKLQVGFSQSQRWTQSNNFNARAYYSLPGEWVDVDDGEQTDLRTDIDRLLVNDGGDRIFLRGGTFDYTTEITPGEEIPGSVFYDPTISNHRVVINGDSTYRILHRNDSGMAGRQVNLTGSNRINLIWSHTLNAKTFYTIKVQRFAQFRKVRVLNDYTKKYGKFLGFNNVWAPGEDNFKDKPQYTHYNAYTERDPIENYFYIRRNDHYWSGDSSFTYDARLDITSQVNRHHQFKAGGQFTYYDIFRHDDQGTSGPTAYPTFYREFPKEGGLYILDKIEYDNVVINVGGRMDYSNAGGEMWSNPLAPLSEQDFTAAGLEYVGWETGKKKFKFSPRIGVAFPLTDKSVVHFNFGHFYQNPNYRDVYRAGGAIREVSMMRGNIIGNPSLENEKSIQYEIGLQQQLGDVYGLNITLWTKETTNQVGSVYVPAYSDPLGLNPYSYSVFLNNNFGSGKGIDITLRKRYSNYLSGRINYSWSRSMVLQQTSWDGYWDGDTQQTQPKREVIADWDQPHTFRANINFSIPTDSGPDIFGKKILSNFGMNFTYHGESGRVYTPYMGESGYLEKQNSARWPFFHQFNLRAYKNIKAFGLDYSFFMDIRNIFDRENVMTGYSRTGSPTDPGDVYQEYSSTYMDGISFNNFGARRSMSFGMRLLF